VLRQEIVGIRRQLRDSVRYDRDGSRLSAEDYRRWRAAAVHAVEVKEEQLGRLRREQEDRLADLRATVRRVLRLWQEEGRFDPALLEAALDGGQA